MGSRLVPGNSRNRRGFFEDADVLAFHDSLLETRGLPVLVQKDFAFRATTGELAADRLN